MKKILFVALPAGIAIFAAVAIFAAFRDRGESTASLLERAQLKREFVERAAVGRALPPERIDEWRDESAALFRWYLQELSAIRNRHPTVPPAPTGAAAAAEERKGKFTEKDRASYGEWQKLADDRFALVKEARYAPLFTATVEGMRLDLLSITTGQHPAGGGAALRIDFALWGAPRNVVKEKQGDVTTTKVVLPIAFRQLAFRMLDEKGKLYGEMSGPGEPFQKLSDPERWIEDFPPGVLFGTWWVDLLPREAVNAELDVDVALRGANGNERSGPFKFTLPVREEWRVAPGAAYEAQTREVAPTP
ncbi:MAG TPA: hypothetical protein VLT47_09520 [Anaeromyxobacteraceae bacterium]|nr:hypothetical protein [Anaeromyxobacteraceae bacterium]